MEIIALKPPSPTMLSGRMSVTSIFRMLSASTAVCAGVQADAFCRNLSMRGCDGFKEVEIFLLNGYFEG